MALIKVNQLTKWIATGAQKIHILNQINFEVEQGETIAILGASGSGKSTLLGLMAGLDTPSSGDIHIGSDNVSTMNEDQRAELRSKMVGFVFQNFFLVPGLTALENVMLPLEVLFKRSIKETAADYLSQVGLGHRMNHLPSQLSGGEQQRVALARAFVTHPKILFADEPTGNLDQHTGAQIIELLFQLNQQMGTTLVLVTHDQNLAQLCHRQMMLNDGFITQLKQLSASKKMV